MLLLKCLILFLLFSEPQISIMDNLFENPHAIAPLLVLLAPLLGAGLSVAGSYAHPSFFLHFVKINCLLLFAVLIYIFPTILEFILLFTNSLSVQVSTVFFEGRYISTIDWWLCTLLALLLVFFIRALFCSLHSAFLVATSVNPQPVLLLLFVITNYLLLLITLVYIFPTVLKNAVLDAENGMFVTD